MCVGGGGRGRLTICFLEAVRDKDEDSGSPSFVSCFTLVTAPMMPI